MRQDRPTGLTLRQIKAQPAWLRRDRELTIHVENLMQGMPVSWVNAVAKEWSDRREKDVQGSAHWGHTLVRKLRAAERSGVLHGDNDADICVKAEKEARLMGELFDAVALRMREALGRRLAPVAVVDDFGAVVSQAEPARWVLDCFGWQVHVRTLAKPSAWLDRVVQRAKAWALRADFARRGLLDLLPKMRKPGAAAGVTRHGLLSRARDDRWWRRVLRKMHAVMLESSAIGLGLVRAGRKGSCYVSDDSLKRRRGQLMRNAAGLAATVAVSDQLEAINLGEIAARGVANKEVRRAELMTRISGFEVIANDMGHRAVFITLTCPSRMHKWRRGDNDMTAANPAYDGTLPSEAQAYLSKQWADFRSAARHAGLNLYGFRIAEPHHDGCPHWHVILWHPGLCDEVLTKPQQRQVKAGKLAPYRADASAKLAALLDRYFLLNDNPDEKGARQYRVKTEHIDPSKGSAVAYVAKYVAKNIDGYKVGYDLWGNAAIEASARVEAWASTWRIRQFQQIGGAPVGVWRELRRLRPDTAPMEACQALHDSLMMCNVAAVDAIMAPAGSESEEQQRIRRGWASYNMAQGGPFVKRRAMRLRVLREATGECNRYGEAGAPVTVGIAAAGFERVTLGAVTYTKPRVDQVESERFAWLVVPAAGEDLAKDAWSDRHAKAQRQALRRQVAAALDLAAWNIDHGWNLEAKGEALRPWTRVNNCAAPEPIGGVKVVRTKKTGRVFRWNEHKVRREGLHHDEPGGEGPPGERVSCHPQGSRAHANPAVESLSHERHQHQDPARAV